MKFEILKHTNTQVITNIMSIKSDFECSYCFKIVKYPKMLPCSDNICDEHLTDPHVLCSNAIVCKNCNKKFEIDNKGNFVFNRHMQSLLNKEIYLSDEEKKMKISFEESIKNYFEITSQFDQSAHVSHIENHFEDLRRQIDAQRVQLKDEIDKISCSMIQETRDMEVKYKSKFRPSFDKEMQTLNEAFRDVNLTLDSIEAMKVKWDAESNEFKSLLDKIDEFKHHLVVSNLFKPMHFERDFFGLLSLVPYSVSDPFKSRILSECQANDLIQLCEFSFDDTWTLLYRGSRDDFGASDFRSKCGDDSPTLTIIKAKQSGYIFGGYTEVSWALFEGPLGFKSDPKAFLFSLTNGDNKPIKMMKKKAQDSIYTCSIHGPIFGRGHDIFIGNRANILKCCMSNLGHTYTHPRYAYGTSEAEEFLAGTSDWFQIEEIEVYQRFVKKIKY